MSIGIYKYTNKINGKIYIGLSSNIEKRYSQHLYCSKQKQPTLGIDKAIKKYGIENFSFEIIELCQIKQLDTKERYWIKYYNSYQTGYNQTIGGKSLRGEQHPRAILTEKDVQDIREQYKLGTPKRKAFEPYIKKGISERCLKKVWDCENWISIHNDVYTEENKQKHKHNSGHSEDQKNLNSFDRSIKQNEINVWVDDYNKGMSINAIAKKYHRDNGTIEKYLNNPQAIKEVKYRGRKVQNTETQQIFNSINSAAKWAGCGATTLTRHLTSDGIAGKVPNTNQPAHWKELS